MPAIYNRHGLQFQYPENWSLEDDSSEEVASVSIFSPDGSYWSVSAHDESADPDALAESVVRTFESEYQGIDTYPIEEKIADCDLAGFDLDFIYLDLITTALIRTVHHGDRWLVIVCQAEDRALTKLRPVFEAITTSLLR